MSSKQLIALGTYHQVQHNGHALNAKFATVISTIIENYDVQVVLEEWWYLPERSFASTLATADLQWRNVGTSDEIRFKTSESALNNHPPIRGDVKPILQEYGPLNVQELRENYMVDHITFFMEAHTAGMLIVGLAHLHSLLSKLKAAGFEVRGYSWIDQRP